jgi:hypothetical protein
MTPLINSRYGNCCSDFHQVCEGARGLNRFFHSRMPLVTMPACLKLLQACDKQHSSRVFAFLTLTCKSCRNTEGPACSPTPPGPSPWPPWPPSPPSPQACPPLCTGSTPCMWSDPVGKSTETIIQNGCAIDVQDSLKRWSTAVGSFKGSWHGACVCSMDSVSSPRLLSRQRATTPKAPGTVLVSAAWILSLALGSCQGNVQQHQRLLTRCPF